MPVNKSEITEEMVEKAMQCKTAEELIALAKTNGIELTKEEAEAYMAELADVELDKDILSCLWYRRLGKFQGMLTGCNEIKKELIENGYPCVGS